MLASDGSMAAVLQKVAPPVTEGLLPGIVREVVMEAVDCLEEPIAGERLLSAREAFLTNSLMEVMPLTHVDGGAIGDGRPGPVTRQIGQAYTGLTQGVNG